MKIKLPFLPITIKYIMYDTDAVTRSPFAGDKNPLLRLVSCILNNSGFNIIALTSLNVTVHELGHAFAHLVLRGTGSDINVSILRCNGVSSGQPSVKKYLYNDKNIYAVTTMAGPVAHALFSAKAIHMGLNCSNKYLSRYLIANGSLFIFGEWVYLLASISFKKGDFGTILTECDKTQFASSVLIFAASSLYAVPEYSYAAKCIGLAGASILAIEELISMKEYYTQERQ